MGFKARLALYHVAMAAPDYRAQAICFLMNVPPEQGACQLDKPKIRGDPYIKSLHKALPSARKSKRKARWEERHEDS
jgi:hypothetical protein